MRKQVNTDKFRGLRNQRAQSPALAVLNKMRMDKVANAGSNHHFHYDSRQSSQSEDPIRNLFSVSDVEVVGQAIDKGLVSVRLTCRLLEFTMEDLNELFVAYDLPYSIDL